MPYWPELSMDNQWTQAIHLDNFALFMPDDWMNSPKKREREYFYGILATIASEYVEELIKDCREQRLGAQ